MEDQTLISDDEEHFPLPETTENASPYESLILPEDQQSDAKHTQPETLKLNDTQSDTINSDARNADLCRSDSDSPSRPPSNVSGENEVKIEAAEKLVPPSGSRDFIVISHHPKPPSVVIQYGTPREKCSCMEPHSPPQNSTSPPYVQQSRHSQTNMAEDCMRANHERLYPALYQQSFQRLQSTLGPIGPAMNGQVYFGDPYQYKQYLELRHAVNPIPGLQPRLVTPQAHSFETNSRPNRLSLPSNRLSLPSNRLALPSNRLALPSALQPGMGANSCISSMSGYKPAHLSGYGVAGCVPMTTSSCGPVQGFGPVVTGCPVPASTGPIATSGAAPTPPSGNTCDSQEDQNRLGEVLSPTLLSSALNLTPPTSNPTSVLSEEKEPELLLPEIPDFGEEMLTLEPSIRADPETPPCNLDELSTLDISSEFELFLGSKLNDHSLDDLLDQTLDESLDSEIKAKVDNLIDEKPIIAIPTPDSTPVKDPPLTNEDNQPSLLISNALNDQYPMSISSPQDSHLPISSMQNISTPYQISSIEDATTLQSLSMMQNVSTPPLPVQATQQNVLPQFSITCPESTSSRLSHFDFAGSATSSLMDIKARFEQASYLRGKAAKSGCLKLTEPTPCLDTKEVAGRAPKSGKRSRKGSRQTCSNKKQNKGAFDLTADNHLLEKVMVDTFLSNEHKAAEQFFDETLFFGGAGGQHLLPKQSSVRNMGRDYQHLVNCNRKDWGSSDVRVRILPSNSQTTEKPLPEDPATSSLPSSGLAEEVDFEKEFLF